jgi:hypothetical protein
MIAVVVQNLLQKVLGALNVDEGAKTPCSFAFTKFKSILSEWKCTTSDLAVPFWQIYAPGARQSDIKKLSLGISAENFMLLADLGDASLLVIKTFGKGKGEKSLFKPLRKFDLKSDDLVTHASLQAAKELLERSAGTTFINKGLFSNYCISEKEAA